MKRVLTNASSEGGSVTVKLVTEACFMSFYSIIIYSLVYILSKVYDEVGFETFIKYVNNVFIMSLKVSENVVYYTQTSIEVN